MNILITGAGGYIGSTLTPMLLDRGHHVTALDRFFFGEKFLAAHPNLSVVKDDIRTFDCKILNGIDAVIDLAAISNDPSGELDKECTWQINHMGRVRVANLAKKQGVKRYILPSSCAVYGFQEDVLTEKSPTNTLTTYSAANLAAEKDILPLNSADFCVTVIRQATVYGLSARMRFDLAINGMIRGFYLNKRIPILRDGTQWRPFVHVKDTCRAMMILLESSATVVGGELFNVGSNEQNYQILPLAELVAESAGIPFSYEWYGDPDQRSYRVDFGKLRSVIGFIPEYSPRHAVLAIWDALVVGKIDANAPWTITVKWYKKLMQEGVRIAL